MAATPISPNLQIQRKGYPTSRRKRNHPRAPIISAFALLLLFLPWGTTSFSWRHPFRACPKSLAPARGNYGRCQSLALHGLQATRDAAANIPAFDTDSEEAHLKGLTTNLFGVCAHIQNPELYSPTWADHAVLREKDGRSRLVACSTMEKGDIISLLPIDAVGLSFAKKDFVVFDQDRDGAYFQDNSHSLKNDKVRMQLSVSYNGQPRNCEIFIDINPNNNSRGPGWMGHLATMLKGAGPNCAVVPIVGATPFCALVAITTIQEGMELISATPLDAAINNNELASIVASKYKTETRELGSYLAMAYQPPLQPIRTDSPERDDNPLSTDFQSAFHTINQNYPGIRYLHRDPDVLAIDNFLSDDECDQITQHASSHLYPCVIKHPVTGEVHEDPSRTSTNANLPQSDVPSIVDKLVRLTQCQDASYLETLQILKYTNGQTFNPHTDGFQGPTTACGFENSGRLVTIFCYLNDVPKGGETRFLEILDRNGEPLSIAPRKGMAVVHFPATTGLEEDPRTEHEGSVAIDDKWLLVTWMWQHPRTDPIYDESNFPSIMGTNL